MSEKEETFVLKRTSFDIIIRQLTNMMKEPRVCPHFSVITQGRGLDGSNAKGERFAPEDTSLPGRGVSVITI